MNADFEGLLPDLILHAVEEELGIPMTGLTAPLPSYINRVYELEDVSGERWIAKFYRPGRWDKSALEDEHQFLLDCVAEEIPVVAPKPLANGNTLGDCDGISFALFPKRSGREMELQSPDDWRRLGRLIGRIHLAGSRRDAPHRLRLHPEKTTLPQIRQLLDGNFMSPHHARQFETLSMQIMEIATSAFEGIELQRIHGDCHRANLLDRPGEGLMAIDFDDMFVGPPVQDIWLLLPGHAEESRAELQLLLEGYEQFLEFDDRSLQLIEILRAMRLIYFLAWCSTQADDFRFRTQFPGWGEEMFWQRELADLERQHQHILRNNSFHSGGLF